MGTLLAYFVLGLSLILVPIASVTSSFKRLWLANRKDKSSDKQLRSGRQHPGDGWRVRGHGQRRSRIDR